VQGPPGAPSARSAPVPPGQAVVRSSPPDLTTRPRTGGTHGRISATWHLQSPVLTTHNAGPPNSDSAPGSTAFVRRERAHSPARRTLAVPAGPGWQPDPGRLACPDQPEDHETEADHRSPVGWHARRRQVLAPDAKRR